MRRAKWQAAEARRYTSQETIRCGSSGSKHRNQ
nr:MAG TPA: hypothetical protein [Caudoviricetes sp.]